MRFGVVGDPVEHSRSPAIHNAGFEAIGIDATFELLPTAYDEFDGIVRELRSGGLDGVSVTMPHKRNAFVAADRLDTLAERSGAVNTMIATGTRIHGHNTDIEGVRYALRRLELPSDQPVLVLGYGGAAAAALLGVEGERRVTISGRIPDRARALARSIGVRAQFVAWATPVPECIVVNATPLGMNGESLPGDVLAASSGLIDMAYGPATTPAIARARASSIPYADGLDMLVGQAAAAFTLFTGRAAPLGVFERAARPD